MTQETERTGVTNQNDPTDFVHTGPGTLAGRYLRMFWQPLFRSQDVKPGQSMPVRVMSEDLTLYRGESGRVYTLGFRCAHRLTQLSTGWIEGENIRCRYHGWLYDSAGQCVGQPAEPEPFCEKVRIPSYPTQEYLGLVFVYLGEGEPPLLPRYPEMEGPGELRVSLHNRPCNYFNNMDNSLDEVHTQFTHWNRRTPLLEQQFLQLSGEETEYGIIRYGKFPNGDVKIAHFQMPNAHHPVGSPRYQSVHWRVPVDDQNHLIPTTALIQPDPDRRSRDDRESDPLETSRYISETGAAIRAGRMTIEELDLDGWYVPITDDVTQVGQGVVADREHERLGRSDAVLILLRKIWERELRALAEGRPLKQWRHPSQELITETRPQLAPAIDG